MNAASRSLVFICGLLIFAVLFPAKACAAEGACGDGLTWSLDAAGMLTVSGTGPMDDWSSASMPWAAYKKTVKAVVIEAGVTTIGTSAFEGFTALQAVTVGPDVKEIGKYAFASCTGLTGVYISDVAAWCGISFGEYTSNPMYYAKALYLMDQPISGELVIPEGVTDIPSYAFYSCSEITSVTIPDSVKTMGSSSFAYCEGLTKVEIGAGLNAIGGSAFAYCTALQTVHVGGLTEIGDYAFWGCTGLTAATLPEGLEKIGHRAFEECTALQTVTFPESLNQIGTYCFYGCGSLKEAVIPASVTAVGDYTFRGCGSMTRLILPKTVTSIGSYAFYGCSSLTALTIPEGIKTVGSHAFQNCTGLTGIQFNAANMDDLGSSNYVFYKAGQSGQGVKLTVGRQVQKLPAYLFYPYSSSTYAPKLVSVEFEQDSVCAAIGKYAFANCKSLKNLYFTGIAPTIGTNAFYKLTAVAFYPEEDSSWTGDMQQSYGGTMTWTAYSALVETADGTVYPSVEAALKTNTGHIKLRTDGAVKGTLSRDLYVDLNGYDLTGTLTLNGYAVFGLDSATDGYTCDSVGYFRCVDENGGEIRLAAHCKYGSKRYLSIKEEEGYGFHRFYLGITHMTLKPNTDGVGYKAVFYGDEQVQQQLDSYGYTLGLGNFTPRTVYAGAESFVSGKTVTLRIDRYDAARFGETPLYASVMLKLSDGTVIESNPCTMTLRGLLEQLNDNSDTLTQVQRQSVAAMIGRHEIMGTWKIENLLQ